MKYDTKITYVCSDCDSTFIIQYNKASVEDEPKFCPICSSYIEEDIPEELEECDGDEESDDIE
jgi:DNA-directed RNA polymerase subunit RPC12/RpoP